VIKRLEKVFDAINWTAMLNVNVRAAKTGERLTQWLPNCGTRTRRPSRWCGRPFCSSTQKKIHFVFTDGDLL